MIDNPFPVQPGWVRIRPANPAAHWESRVACGQFEVQHGADGSLTVPPEHARALLAKGGYVVA
jgi:hypothetical protein